MNIVPISCVENTLLYIHNFLTVNNHIHLFCPLFKETTVRGGVLFLVLHYGTSNGVFFLFFFGMI